MKKMILCALVAALIAPAMMSCAEEKKSPIDQAADAAKAAVDEAKDAAKDVKAPEAPKAPEAK